MDWIFREVVNVGSVAGFCIALFYLLTTFFVNNKKINAEKKHGAGQLALSVAEGLRKDLKEQREMVLSLKDENISLKKENNSLREKLDILQTEYNELKSWCQHLEACIKEIQDDL